MIERPYRLADPPEPLLPNQCGWFLGMPVIADTSVPPGVIEFRARDTGNLVGRITDAK